MGMLIKELIGKRISVFYLQQLQKRYENITFHNYEIHD